LHEAGYTDLRPAHANVLQFIDERGSRIQDMASRAQVNWQSMAELVIDLERLGYVIRKPDPSDRRAKLVFLTERGRELTPLAISAMREKEDQWAEKVGQEAVDQLRGTLRRLWARM
jgi:DNA-binding MarR family transcriptional regulator